MKRYYYSVEDKGKKFFVNIYKVKNNKIEVVSTYQDTTVHRGMIHDVFQHLMEIGEIPKKYENSSKTDWSGGGYFMGEVKKHYELIDLEKQYERNVRKNAS